MRRIVVTSCIVALAALLTAGPAWAGPETSSGTLFGYAGPRPLDPTTPTGIARPTPAPRLETASFGAAARCLPARPRMVTPTPAPDCFGTPSRVRRVVVTGCAERACSSCDPCDPCAPCCPTTRVHDDPLSVSPHQWSSGYHDGNEARHCDPCAPCATQPVYRSPCEPCEPCAEPCEPCATRVVVRRPVRIVRRVCEPCYAPCFTPCRTWCAPRIRLGIAPCWGGGWGWGAGWGLGWGLGWGWGGGCW